LMLYFPELSDSGRMAVVAFPCSEGTSSQNTPPLSADENGTSRHAPQPRTARGTDASDQPGKWVVRVGADGRLFRAGQR
jgi:hypothetical protein